MSVQKNISSEKLPNNKNLTKILPVGFYDLVHEEAEINHLKINTAIDYFLSYGFRLFKAPLIEFESNFSSEHSENSFRLIDNISNKNLLLRQDITPQIARLIQTRFKDEKFPIKLCYVGDVLVTKSNDFYQDREQTQVGIESIGEVSEIENFEIAAITIDALKKLAVKDLLIEFYLPDFCQIFLSEINQSDNEKLLSAIYQKNISEIKKIVSDVEIADIIIKIVVDNQDLSEISNAISSKIKSIAIKQELAKAERFLDFINQKFDDIKICFDLFGDDNKSYHQNFSFDIFSTNFPYPIAKGGCYKINTQNSDFENNNPAEFSKEIDAVGSTIYMNFLRKIF